MFKGIAEFLHMGDQVKFKVRESLATTLECDLCINNVLACHNTALIFSFTLLDWR